MRFYSSKINFLVSVLLKTASLDAVFLFRMKMKTFVTLFLIALNVSCAALMNPQEQPVNLVDSKAKIYTTTCSGMAETLGSCYQKARRTCQYGYKLLNESQNNSGAQRQITFQCKES